MSTTDDTSAARRGSGSNDLLGLVERLREAAQGEELFGFDGLRDEPDALLTEAADEIERLRAELAMVADIAHSGGLTGHDDFSALTAVRRLTLEAWNPRGNTDEHRKRVHEANREAGRRAGA